MMFLIFEWMLFSCKMLTFIEHNLMKIVMLAFLLSQVHVERFLTGLCSYFFLNVTICLFVCKTHSCRIRRSLPGGWLFQGPAFLPCCRSQHKNQDYQQINYSDLWPQRPYWTGVQNRLGIQARRWVCKLTGIFSSLWSFFINLKYIYKICHQPSFWTAQM